MAIVNIKAQPKDLLTFVCCIEYGRLEKQTILMVETLRANAGEFSKCRVIAVVGRLGPRLSKSTIEILDNLDVEIVYAKNENPVPWFPYANKIVAVSVAQSIATTPTVAWLDSDLLFLSEPKSFLLKINEDIVASLEYFPPAVVEDDNTHLPYWEELCNVLDFNFEEIPFVHNELNFNKLQKVYCTSGIFVWRRSTSFAKAYRNAFISVFDSRVALHTGDFFQNDQVILSPIIYRENYRWRLLDFQDQHITLPGIIEGISASPNMAKSNVLHYSASLNQPYREKYMDRLSKECPEIIDFILRNDSLVLHRSIIDILIHTLLKYSRAICWRWYGKFVKRVPKG